MSGVVDQSFSGARVRSAAKADAAALTILADIAGYGLPSWLWYQSSERRATESVLAFGRRRILREDSAFSWRSAYVAEADGEVAGMLLGYRQPDEADEIPDDLPDVLRPLLELEARAPGTWYVNILSVFEEFQGRGIGRALLRKADQLAEESEARGLSIIVESDNVNARRVYERSGFRSVDARPFVPYPGCAPADEWILLVKPGAGPAPR